MTQGQPSDSIHPGNQLLNPNGKRSHAQNDENPDVNQPKKSKQEKSPTLSVPGTSFPTGLAVASTSVSMLAAPTVVAPAGREPVVNHPQANDTEDLWTSDLESVGEDDSAFVNDPNPTPVDHPIVVDPMPNEETEGAMQEEEEMRQGNSVDRPDDGRLEEENPEEEDYATEISIVHDSSLELSSENASGAEEPAAGRPWRLSKRRLERLVRETLAETETWPSDLGDDMYRALREQEERIPLEVAEFMDDTVQRRVTPHMRAMLVDWVVSVAQDFHLTSDTLFMCISLLDRFLARVLLNGSVDVGVADLQLVALTSIYLAAKFEEVRHPPLNALLQMAENVYTREQVVRMERTMLEQLDFDIVPVTLKHFVRRILRMVAVLPPTWLPQDRLESLRHLVAYLGELTLLHPCFLSYRPSDVAAALVVVAAATLGAHDPWVDQLEVYCDLPRNSEILVSCVQLTHRMHSLVRTARYGASRSKYSLPQYRNVASIPALSESPL